MGAPWTFEITQHVGVPILDHPDWMNDDGTLRAWYRFRLSLKKNKVQVMLTLFSLVVAFLLGLFTHWITDTKSTTDQLKETECLPAKDSAAKDSTIVPVEMDSLE